MLGKIFRAAVSPPGQRLGGHCAGLARGTPRDLGHVTPDDGSRSRLPAVRRSEIRGLRCPRGDLNPHALIRALAPQASASANSATRTSAEGTLATHDPIPHIGSRRSECQDGVMSDDRTNQDQQSSYTPSYAPTEEVVDLCRDLIRIDTSNYGDEAGPGERKAAEHVAALLDEVGIDSELFERDSGRTSLVAQWGANSGGEGALLLHGHLDVVPAEAADWQVDHFSGEIENGHVWGRVAVDMKDFDAMLLSVVRARTRAKAV